MAGVGDIPRGLLARSRSFQGELRGENYSTRESSREGPAYELEPIEKPYIVLKCELILIKIYFYQ